MRINDNKMDNAVTILREKQKIRDAQFSRRESQQNVEYDFIEKELENLKETMCKSMKTTEKNINFITSHKHAISKVVHESKQNQGLPISNKHHKQTVEFLNYASEFVNNGKNLFMKPETGNSIDACKLSADVQFCTQLMSDVYKAIQLSIGKEETFLYNLPFILNQYTAEDERLDMSIYDN